MHRKLFAIVCLFGLFFAAPADARRICPILCGGKRAVVPWTPLNLGSILVEWWDASSLSASPVASWTGKKLGTVASAVTNQPTWSATARNGKPGVVYVSPQTLTFTPTGFPSGGTSGGIALRGFSSTTPTPIGQQFAFSYGSNTTGAGLTRYVDQQANIDPTPGATGAGTAGTGDNVTDTVSWATSDRFVVFQISGTTGMVNTDGNTTVSATLTNATNTGVVAGAIGSWPPFGNSWAGVIQQVYVTVGILSTNARQCLEGFDSYYVGLAGANLATANPYSSTGTLHRAPLTSDNCT